MLLRLVLVDLADINVITAARIETVEDLIVLIIELNPDSNGGYKTIGNEMEFIHTINLVESEL